MKLIHTALFLLLGLSSALLADDSDKLLEQSLVSSRKTMQALRTGACSWRCVFQPENKARFEIEALRSDGKTLLKLYSITPEEKRLRLTLLMHKDAWYLSEGKRHIKSRPYESPISSANAYYYILSSKPQVLTPNFAKSLGEKRAFQGQLAFRRKLSPDEQFLLSQVVLSGQKKQVMTEYQKVNDQLKKRLAPGRTFMVNPANGIVEMISSASQYLQIRDFKILDTKEVAEQVEADEDKNWIDLSDIINAPQALFSFNAHWQPGSPHYQTDARIYHNGKKIMRRLPFRGVSCRPWALSKDGRQAYVTGSMPNMLGTYLFEVDLTTGKMRSLLPREYPPGNCREVRLSPNGEIIAFLYQPFHKDQKEFLCLFNRKTLQVLDTTTHWDTICWNADNKTLTGCALKDKQLKLFHIKGDGNHTPIGLGSNPYLLTDGSKQIIFQDTLSNWYAFDGKDSKTAKPFTAFNPKMQHPALASDGTALILVRGKKDEPLPLIFKSLDKKARKLPLKEEGLYLYPVVK